MPENGVKISVNATSIGVFLTLLAQIVTGLYFILSLSGDIKVLDVRVQSLERQMEKVIKKLDK